jgi:site-specific DNA-methyltransferase (adenine-specific)
LNNYHEVLVANILVGDRFRQDYGDMDGLKRSIQTHGLIEPIILDRENNLLCGGRRYKAYSELGLERIPALYRDEVDDLLARELELEENIQRKEMSWDEVADLTKEIHTLKQAKYAGHMAPATTSAVPDDERIEKVKLVEGWTQSNTAELMEVSPATVTRQLYLADVLEIMPELRDEDSASQALKKIDRRLEELEREFGFRQLKKAGKLEEAGQVLLGDCVELLEKIDDKSIDCIIIDPPYGVLEAGGIGRYEQHFDDDPVTAMRTLTIVAKELQRVAKPNAHVYVFFGIKMSEQTRGIFVSAGFDVDLIPLVWIKTTGSVVDWDFRFANYYEPILFISNRTRRLNYKRSNVFEFASVPNNLRANVAEKPVELIRELLRLSTNEGDLVLDCFAGSGVVGVASKELKRRFILMEKNQSQWNEIQIRLAAVVPIQDQEPTSDQPVELS